MFYEKSITLPPNTDRSSPVSEVIPIHPGKVQQVSVFFPEGCSGLAHLTISLWGHQLWPSNPDGFFTGDNTLIVFPEDLQIIDPPYELILTGWNEDDTYPHTPIVRIQITPKGNTTNQLLELLSIGPSGPVTE
jgi:hypothetical protein